MHNSRADIIAQLKKDILLLSGTKQPASIVHNQKLPFFAEHMPNGSFPLGAVHEFLYSSQQDKTASLGFIAALQTTLLPPTAVIVWVTKNNFIYPPALAALKLQPQQLIFIQPATAKEALWIVEEALQCQGVSTVIADIDGCTFTQSRRFQLAVEKSNTTGFIICPQKKVQNSNACFSRWQVKSLPSEPIQNLPGVGYSKWSVTLQKMRNGKLGSWELVWDNKKLREANIASTTIAQPLTKTAS
jgi:protein ImuA